MNFVSSYFGDLLVQLPVIIACFVAIVVLLDSRNRLGGATVFGVTGFVLFILIAVTFPLLTTIVRVNYHQLPFSVTAAFTIIGVLRGFVVAFAMFALLLAILKGRGGNSQ